MLLSETPPLAAEDAPFVRVGAKLGLPVGVLAPLYKHAHTALTELLPSGPHAPPTPGPTHAQSHSHAQSRSRPGPVPDPSRSTRARGPPPCPPCLAGPARERALAPDEARRAHQITRTMLLVCADPVTTWNVRYVVWGALHP